MNELAITALETAINHYLSLDPGVIERLTKYRGSTVALHITTFSTTLFITLTAQGMELSTEPPETVSATISGPISAFAKLAFSQDAIASKQLFSDALSLTGDTVFAAEFSAILNGMDIDWEEHLSALTGDLIAHQAGELFRSTRAWHTSTTSALKRNLREFIIEEIKLSPSREELEDFYNDISELSIDLSRLTARVKRINDTRNDSEGDE